VTNGDERHGSLFSIGIFHLIRNLFRTASEVSSRIASEAIHFAAFESIP